MDELQRGFLEAARDGRAYDYIAQHYWEMDKTDLKTILLEYIFGFQKLVEGHDYVEADVVQEIEEWFDPWFDPQ